MPYSIQARLIALHLTWDAYRQSAATLNLIRAFATGGYDTAYSLQREAFGQPLAKLGANYDIIAECRMELAAGDTVSFPGREPHSWMNPSDEPAVVTWTLVL